VLRRTPPLATGPSSSAFTQADRSVAGIRREGKERKTTDSMEEVSRKRKKVRRLSRGSVRLCSAGPALTVDRRERSSRSSESDSTWHKSADEAAQRLLVVTEALKNQQRCGDAGARQRHTRGRADAGVGGHVPPQNTRDTRRVRVAAERHPGAVRRPGACVCACVACCEFSEGWVYTSIRAKRPAPDS